MVVVVVVGWSVVAAADDDNCGCGCRIGTGYISYVPTYLLHLTSVMAIDRQSGYDWQHLFPSVDI